DDLAAQLVRDAVLFAEADTLRLAGDAGAILERAGGVVDPGVDHAAVVAGLVLGNGRFLVEYAHAEPAPACEQLPGRGQAHDPGTHDRYVESLVRHRPALSSSRRADTSPSAPTRRPRQSSQPPSVQGSASTPRRS